MDADLGGGDLAEEHPLCCCRIETPSSKEATTAGEQTCMAIESSDGMVGDMQETGFIGEDVLILYLLLNACLDQPVCAERQGTTS